MRDPRVLRKGRLTSCIMVITLLPIHTHLSFPAASNSARPIKYIRTCVYIDNFRRTAAAAATAWMRLYFFNTPFFSSSANSNLCEIVREKNNHNAKSKTNGYSCIRDELQMHLIKKKKNKNNPSIHAVLRAPSLLDEYRCVGWAREERAPSTWAPGRGIFCFAGCCCARRKPSFSGSLLEYRCFWNGP